MPEPKKVVINTGPLIALVAGLRGDLKLLSQLYEQILLPRQAWEELRAGGPAAPELQAVTANPTLQIADSLILSAAVEGVDGKDKCLIAERDE